MASNEKRFVGYIKMKTRNHFNIKFRNKDERQLVIGNSVWREALKRQDVLIMAWTRDFRVEGKKIKSVTEGNAVTFKVIEDSRYYNGFRATDLKLYKKPAKKSAKKSVKKKVTLEKWLKDTRPTIAKMTDNDWYKLEADDDHDWMSRYKLPLPPLE